MAVVSRLVCGATGRWAPKAGQRGQYGTPPGRPNKGPPRQAFAKRGRNHGRRLASRLGSFSEPRLGARLRGGAGPAAAPRGTAGPPLGGSYEGVGAGRPYPVLDKTGNNGELCSPISRVSC